MKGQQGWFLVWPLLLAADGPGHWVSHCFFSAWICRGRERVLCLLSCLLTRRPVLLDQSLTFTILFYCLLQGSVARYSHMQIQASTCELGREESVQSITPVHMDIWCEELTHWKDPDPGKDWGQEKGTTEDEMVGWHHQLNGHGFDLTPGVGCSAAVHGVTKSQTWLSNMDIFAVYYFAYTI